MKSLEKVFSPIRLSALLILIVAAGVTAFLLARSLSGGSNPTGAQTVPQSRSPDVSGPLPDFGNKVIHYQVNSFHYQPAGIDSANGKAVVRDVWVRFDSSNNPVASRSISRFEDGSFHQAELASVLTGAVRHSFDQPLGTPEHPVCTGESKDPNSLSIALKRALPLFLHLKKAEGAGLGPIAKLVEQPLALGKDGEPAAPERVVGPQGNQVWIAGDVLAGPNTTHEEDQVDPVSGLVQVHTLDTRNPRGELVDQSWSRFTAIDVFADSAAFDSILASVPLPNGC